jgi:cell division protein FtsA
MFGRSSRARGAPVAALDIGTTKTCCVIARTDGDRLEVLGVGHHQTRGVKAGRIVDLELARQAILDAVQSAEQSAGETLRGVWVNLPGGGPSSRTYTAEVDVEGREIGDAEMTAVLDRGRRAPEQPDRSAVHAIPTGFTIDGSRGIRDPRGMFARRLGVNVHVVSAATPALRTLNTAINHCHLDIQGVVIGAYASGLAVLVDDERELGATVIDMGGGTTSIAIFHDGNLVFTDQVPIGGQHVTSDIAGGLNTPLAHAEMMKTLYGTALASGGDAHVKIKVPLIGEEASRDDHDISQSILTGIIQPRVEETFELVRYRIESSGYDKVAGRRVVLTGGAAQLTGVRDLAALVLDRQVRVGRPNRLPNLPDSIAGSAFATVTGLLGYALEPAREPARRSSVATLPPAGVFGRLGLWLRENF